jgi:cytochrome c peroxidase
LFNNKAMCNQCHPSAPGPYSTGSAAGKALFTDFTYDNLGLPANPDIDALLGVDALPDYGLGGFLSSIGMADEALLARGAFKVPTLRNVGKTAPYGHNGVFRTLPEIVHFYNTRDVPGAGWNGVGWDPPEVPENVNVDELGKLGMTSAEESDLVAFLRTLNDKVEYDPWWVR